MSKTVLQLGHDHTLEFTSWRPDRSLNPQYADWPDVDKIGAILTHKKPDGSLCVGSILFESDTARFLFPKHKYWMVEETEPLTLSPSVLCTECGDHGNIVGGKWHPLGRVIKVNS